MTLKRFFAYSLVVHTLIIVAALSHTPAVKGNKSGEFFARLVSPEEMSSPEETRKFKIKPLPAIPAITDTRSLTSVMPNVITPLQKGNLPAPPEQDTSDHDSLLPPGYQSPRIEEKPESKEITQKPDRHVSIREKLFDKSIIGDLAKAEIEKGEKEKKEKRFTLDTKEYKFLIYNNRLKERIESIWIYPPDAATMGIYGDLIIKFTIKKNGRLGAVELIRTSGHKSLDDAAMKALWDCEPFWPLPDEWGMEAYTIEGHFIYTIYGYYVR